MEEVIGEMIFCARLDKSENDTLCLYPCHTIVNYDGL